MDEGPTKEGPTKEGPSENWDSQTHQRLDSR